MIVVWCLLDICNLSCPFCAYNKRQNFVGTQIDPSDVLRFAGVLADYQAATGDPVMISWLGGEPLRWKPLEELTLDIRTLGLGISATTNGTTLGSARVRKHIHENHQELTISVDGFSDLHDSMRGWPGGFDKLRCWVTMLSDEARGHRSRLKLRANIVLMRDNVERFSDLCSEISNWGITEITFNQLGGRDRPEFHPDHRLRPSDVDALEAILPVLRSRLFDRGVTLIGGKAYLDRIRASTMNERNPIEECNPAESFLFIDEKGLLSPCSFTTDDYGIDVGSLATAMDIVALPGIFRQARRARCSAQCEDCLSTQVCEKFSNPNRNVVVSWNTCG